MNTYNLYIGSNNDTHELELNTIEKITGSLFQGFSLSQTTGYWNGKKEQTAIVTIATDESALVTRLATILKEILKQEAVMINQIGMAQFI